MVKILPKQIEQLVLSPRLSDAEIARVVALVRQLRAPGKGFRVVAGSKRKDGVASIGVNRYATAGERRADNGGSDGPCARHLSFR